MKIYLKKSNNYTRDITFLNESKLIEVNKTNISSGLFISHKK